MDEELEFCVYNSLKISDARYCILDIIDEFRKISNHLNLDIFNTSSSYTLLNNYIGKYCFIFIDCFN